MKNNCKKFVIAACICIGVGLIFIIFGAAFGGLNIAKGIVVDHVAGFRLPFSINFNANGAYGIGSIDDSEDLDDLDEVNTFDMDEFSKLDIDFVAGILIMEETDEDDIQVKYAGDVDIEQNNDVLEISCEKESFIFGRRNAVKILVPKDMNWAEANIKIAAAKAELKNINCSELDLSLDAGDVLLERLNCTHAHVKLDAGEIVMKEAVISQLESDVDMGSFQYEGKVESYCSADVDAGSILMKLDGGEKDFNYHLDVDMGNITVGGKSYSGVADSEDENEGATATMDLDCDLGDITVLFNEKIMSKGE